MILEFIKALARGFQAIVLIVFGHNFQRIKMGLINRRIGSAGVNEKFFLPSRLPLCFQFKSIFGLGFIKLVDFQDRFRH
jgi:hypothetical protein